MSLLSKLRRRVLDTRPTALRGLDITTRTDARGFNQAMITDLSRRQITISSTVDNAVILSEDLISQWNTGVADTERMMVCFAADSTAPDVNPLLGATFRPTGKVERKDLTELATWLSINGPSLYDTALQLGMEATPADKATLLTRAATLLQPEADRSAEHSSSFDDLADLGWEEHADHLDVGSAGFSVFTVATSVPGVAADLDDLLSVWDLPAQLTRTRWMRPYAHPELLAELELSGAGRTWATVTVSGGAGSDTAFIKALHPLTRLHTRRAYLRQSSLMTASLGLGITGFQNLTVDKELLS